MDSPIVENISDPSVIKQLHDLNLYDRLIERAPPCGAIICSVCSPYGVRVFVGRFHMHNSLGWLSYTIPNASQDSPWVRFVVERIMKAYAGTMPPILEEIAVSGRW